MEATVLAISGLPGSGKTTAGLYFQKTFAAVVRMGDITQDILNREEKKDNETNEKHTRETLRQHYGEEIYAALTAPKVVILGHKYDPVVVEGMRSFHEYNFFRSVFAKLQVMYIHTDTSIRYRRLLNRSNRPLTENEAVKRDKYETGELKGDELKGIADFHISNNGEMADFINKLKEITIQLQSN